MTKLTCKDVLYNSQFDEEMFFMWLNKISCVIDIGGAGNELHINVSDQDIHDQDLRELVALYDRYGINGAELRQFLNDSNRSWFKDNKSAFWYQNVWGE